MSRRYLAISLTVFGLILGGLTVPSSAQQSCQVGDAVILAVNSARLDPSVVVTSGNIVVNNALTGPTLVPGFSLSIGTQASIAGSIAADRIKLSQQVVITGTASFNQLTNDGATIGGLSTPLSLPVFGGLPAFQEATFRGPVSNVTVAGGATTVLAAGEYGNVVVGANGTVIFTGGQYSLQSISAGQNAKLTFNAASEVRIAGRFQTGRNSTVGPATGSGLTAASIVFYIAGINGANGQLGSTPKAAQIDRDSTVAANFYVPNGTLQIDRGIVASGAFFARDIQIDQQGQLARASAFVNGSPVAAAQDVFTDGAAPLVITLTARDPEGGDMTFALQGALQFPSRGTLGSVINAPPPFPGNPPGCNPVNVLGCVPPDPPRSSATITYTPNTAANEENSFSFSATDACGNTGVATVKINPAADSTNPPIAGVVDATTVAVETPTNTPRDVTLVAGAPPGATLTFSVESLPAPGNSLKDGTGAPIGSVPYTLPSRIVTYTPSSTFTGLDTFIFKATGTVGGSDTASVLINVQPLPELAVDQSVNTAQDTPVEITLQGNPGGTGVASEADSRGRAIVRQAQISTGASAAGNVSDANADGLGDGRDNLPGAAPVLVAAGVDVNLNAGTVTDPDNDASPSPNPTPGPDVISANVGSDGTNLFLRVRYKAGTFDPQLTRAQFVLDTDQNPSTGHLGSDSGCVNDNGIIGAEFLVNMGADLGTNAEVLQYQGTCNSFASVGNGTTTFVTDGMDATVPLSLLGGGNGHVNYKVVISEQIGVGSYTGVLDYMPNVGLAPGQSRTGIQGVARIQIEWDVSTLPTAAESIESAQVLLSTLKGTVDSLNTFFFAGTAEQDGVLAVSDYQAPATQIAGVTMPVPAVPTGTEGTFSIDVTSQVRAARAAGRSFFSIQGRVNEALAGGGFQRGLQVRSTATGNLTSGKEPKLEVVTAPIGAGLTFRITTLPLSGILRFGGVPVFVNQTFLSAPTLLYTPNIGVTGGDSFIYQVTQGGLSDLATVSINVAAVLNNCQINGRPAGCFPQ